MVKGLLKKFGGVIFFYLTIIGMITIINYRFSYLNNNYNNDIGVICKK